ncbi:MAG: alpha/beta fold hydrolase [Actinobacteria bacterium]|nr:alpha/beta fold hydrolase [Actinomycetota bacterium]
MSTVFIVILLLLVVFVAASVVLSRTTHEVQSARDTEYLELEGNWIRYRVLGGGPPVVLVHGWLSSGRIWEPLADRLAQRFTVYTLDLSGFGESDKPISGYGVRYGSRLLYALCAHFGLTHATIVGHDVGGAMTMKLAADHPDVVGRIVLVATPADENQVDLPTLLWLATLPVVGPIFYALGRLLRPLRRLWMRPFVFDSEDLDEEVVEDVGRSTPAAVRTTLEVMRREIARGRLVRQAGVVKVPVLAVAGEEDQIVDPQAAHDWAQAVSAEVVLLDECGHLPMLERTSEFNARVLAFLTGDTRYLDTITATPEETTGEDEDVTTEEPSEEQPPFARAEPETPESTEPPNVVRKQDGRYPPRERDHHKDSERQDAGDTEGRRDTSSGPDGDNGAEESAPDRGRRETGGDADRPLPELPGHLFEWPELKEPRPWDRSRETGRQPREERDEDEDPEDPKKEPRS